MVNATTGSAAPGMPWLQAPLQAALARRGHALLLHGPQGAGLYELALALAQAWLCETGGGTQPACGHCGSCKLMQSRTHADLLVLLPDAWKESLGWDFSNEDDSASADKAAKAKPSKDIKVEAVRRAVQFAQTTSARGRGKVVLAFPAERMNAIAANALLKTLEEPPGDARFVLACGAPDAMLPTVRSRCEALALAVPEAGDAARWLAAQGVADAPALLQATGGQPQDALAWAQEGLTAAQWQALPRQIARGEVGTLAAWPLPRVVEMLQKLCHDAMRRAAGGLPRYFPADGWPAPAPLQALGAWARELQRLARHAEHPWSQALAVEALVQQAQQALCAPA